MKRSESGGMNPLILIFLLAIGCWVVTVLYDWMMDVKYERKYGKPRGATVEEEVDPDAYTGPKGYQIRE